MLSKGTGILRERNKRKVLSLIRQLERTSRQDLAKKMNVSKNTISLIVDEFINHDILKEVGFKEPGTKGRPKAIIEINKDGYRSIGLGLSKTYLEYAVTNYYGQVIESDSFTFNNNDPEKTKNKLRSMIKPLIQKYDNILGIGISIPGIVDAEKKIVYESTHLGWKNVTFLDFEVLDIPLFVENSVNMGALNAIEQESHQMDNSSFYVRVGEGVGGAYIVDNNIMNGGSWTAGEIGHISIDPQGELCECGQRGCLELLINNHTFQKKLAKLGFSTSLDKIQCSNMKTVPQEIRYIMNDFGSNLGKALVQVIHLINPHQIIIDSPYDQFEDFSIGCLTYIKNNALEIPYKRTKVIFCKDRYKQSVGAALYSIINHEIQGEVPMSSK